MKNLVLTVAILFLAGCVNNTKDDSSASSKASNLCENLGPQTPRDISNKMGENSVVFEKSGPYQKLNLCNIHFHKNAENKGPEFSVFKGDKKDGGFACNKTSQLTPSQLKPVSGACKGVNVGDTVEIHWVHSSCDIKPGPTLGSCLAPECTKPKLRVETQVFLLVNDSKADNFADYRYSGKKSVSGFHQAKKVPSREGAVEFLGSTTGPKYNNKICSPFKVNWSVAPTCRTLDIKSLHKWCEKNVFNEDHAHGVRKLVTNPKFLSPIK